MAKASPLPVEFAVTPRFDIFYALYTLTSSSRTLLDRWRERALLRLPRDFDRVTKRVAPVPLFWPLLADALQGTAGEISFDAILVSLRELSAEDLKKNVLSGIFHDRDAVDSLVSGKKSLRQLLRDEKLPGGELLVHFGLRPYSTRSHAAEAITRLLSRPNAFRDELSLVLQRFWQSGFERDWAGLEPGLRTDAERMQRIHAEGTAGGLAREVDLPVSLDDRAREITARSGAPVGFDRVDHCYIIPSAFNTRRWWAKYETSAGRVSLYFPITSASNSPNTIGEDTPQRQSVSKPGAKRSATVVRPEAVFRALGDTTRYAIASILARTPTTSADLARSLRLSKPTITHHVQALRAADLIEEMNEGGSTRLTLRRDTIDALSTAAVEQLFSSIGDLPLLTTRKRREVPVRKV
jgi:DNA-binding transcriptional ArsR family regulator